jgi:hypothetical protein
MHQTIKLFTWWLQFNFSGMNFHFPQVTGYGNYEALKDCKNVCYISQLEQANCLHGQDKVWSCWITWIQKFMPEKLNCNRSFPSGKLFAMCILIVVLVIRQSGKIITGSFYFTLCVLIPFKLSIVTVTVK